MDNIMNNGRNNHWFGGMVMAEVFVMSAVFAGCVFDSCGGSELSPRVAKETKAVLYVDGRCDFEVVERKAKEMMRNMASNPDYACVSNIVAGLLETVESDDTGVEAEWGILTVTDAGNALTMRGEFPVDMEADEVRRHFVDVVCGKPDRIESVKVEPMEVNGGCRAWTLVPGSGSFPAIGLGEEIKKAYAAVPVEGLMVLADSYEALIRQTGLYTDAEPCRDSAAERDLDGDVVIRVADCGSYLKECDIDPKCPAIGLDFGGIGTLLVKAAVEDIEGRDRISFDISLGMADGETAKTFAGLLQLLKSAIDMKMRELPLEDGMIAIRAKAIGRISVGCSEEWVKVSMPLDLDELIEISKMRSDPAKARERRLGRLVKQAETGDAVAMWKLGNAYSYGCYGVKKDADKAFKYYSDAAARGDCGGLSRLGYCYERGQGVAKDEKKAYEYYLKAEKAGSGFALNALGDCCEKGIGTETNLEAAVGWWKRAAEEKRHGWAACKVAIRYQKDKKPDEAFAWFRKSADLGSDYGCCKLGECYERGWGTETNAVLAAKWFLKGAERLHGWGMEKTGDFYRDGYGVEKNLDKAREWYEKAVKRGNKNAQKKLDALRAKDAGAAH